MVRTFNVICNAVLLYPLILQDRLELILVTPYGPPIRRTSIIALEDLRRQVGNCATP